MTLTENPFLTGNYGQYSALTILGTGLPAIYSGHNSTWDWGRPPDGAGPVIVVAWSLRDAQALFDGCRVVATIDNGVGVQTEEQGAPILLCGAPRAPWSELWPSLREVG